MHRRILYLTLFLVPLLHLPVSAHGQLFTKAATPPIKDGFYVVDVWTYDCTIILAETRSEGRRGRLLYKGHELVAPEGTVVITPVRRFMFFPYRPPKVALIWGADGWLNTGCYDEPIFQKDGSPVDKSSKVNIVDVTALLKMNNLLPSTSSE